MLRQREPRTRDKAYMGFVAQLPCVACMVEGVVNHEVEVAHVRSGYPSDGWRPTGMQEKPSDRRTTPLCPAHHREGPEAQHGRKENLWWVRLGIHPPRLCRALEAAYPDVEAGAKVIERFAVESRIPLTSANIIGGLTAPIPTVRPCTITAHLGSGVDCDGNLEVLLPGVRGVSRAFVAPDAVEDTP